MERGGSYFCWAGRGGGWGARALSERGWARASASALSFKGGIYPHHRNEVTGGTEHFVVTNLTLLIRTWSVYVRLSQTARQFHQSGVRIFNMLEMICLEVFAAGKIF